jgi:hypothetical protein
MLQEMYLGLQKKYPHSKDLLQVVKNIQLKVIILNVKIILRKIPYLD